MAASLVCRTCGGEKPREAFYPQKRECKSCVVARSGRNAKLRQARDPQLYSAMKVRSVVAWQKSHPDRWAPIRRRSARAWYARNPAAQNAWSKARKLARRRAMPAWADKDAIRAVYELAGRVQKSTGVRMSVDHIVPLRGRNVCGLHVHNNLQIIPLRDNQAKGNRYVAEAN